MEQCKDAVCRFYRWMFCKDLEEIKGWESVAFILCWIALLTLITLPLA